MICGAGACQGARKLAGVVGRLAAPHDLLVALLAYGGLRIGEAFALRRGDFDLANCLVIVDENLSEADGKLSFDSPKSHQKRVLSLPPSLVKRVATYLGTLVAGDAVLLFTNRHGRPLRYNQWRKACFDPAVKAAGLSDVTPHDLRASHGTWVADRYGVMTAARRLGHSNASVTTRHYARPVAGRDAEVAKGMETWASGHGDADMARERHGDDDDGLAGVPARV